MLTTGRGRGRQVAPRDAAQGGPARQRPRPPVRRVLVLVPTYNERDNLPMITARVRETVPEADILILEDNSPDGTGQIADALRELPGWNLERGALVKQFSFSDFVHALNFVNLLSENLQRFATHLSFDLSFGKVRVALSSPTGSGIGSRDIELAKLIEKL